MFPVGPRQKADIRSRLGLYTIRQSNPYRYRGKQTWLRDKAGGQCPWTRQAVEKQEHDRSSSGSHNKEHWMVYSHKWLLRIWQLHTGRARNIHCSSQNQQLPVIGAATGLTAQTWMWVQQGKHGGISWKYTQHLVMQEQTRITTWCPGPSISCHIFY